MTEPDLPSARLLPDPPRASLWAVILAGGEGTRLLPLTRWITGDGRPKQFCNLTGTETLLEATVRRTARLIPTGRQVLSLTRAHARYYEPLLAECGGVLPVVQPENRGTGLGLLYPALHVARLDPEATVAIFPSDHFIMAADRFMTAVDDAARAVSRHPGITVLLGIVPSDPEPEYGWIEPGEALEATPVGRLRRVRRFVEKPPRAWAREMLRTGWVWNTLVVVTRVAELFRLATRHVPRTVGPLLAVAEALGTPAEASAMSRAYATARAANLSRDLLERARGSLAVLEVNGVTWSDWGTPRRVVATLTRLGQRPAWMTGGLRKDLARVGDAAPDPAQRSAPQASDYRDVS